MLIRGNNFNANFYNIKSLFFLFFFFFNKNFNFFYSKSKNYIYIYSKVLKMYYVFFLPAIYFLKNNTLYLNFLFFNKLKFFSVINNFFFNYIYLKTLNFFRLKLRGLGFFIKRYSSKFFCFFMALNHYFFFHVPINVFVKKKKKHFIFLSTSKSYLNNIFWNLMFLKKHNVYVKIKGIGGFIKPNFIRFIKKKNKL